MTGLKFITGACVAAVCAVWPLASPMAAPSSPELLIDVATGNVLFEDEGTRPWFPASTTKMMTAYVALRMIKNGQVKLETPLVASAKAASQAPSKIGIRPRQEITLDNALKILMVKSANDVAYVIAEGLGGSVDGFSNLMNAEAARLGMRDSHFVNPNGLHHGSHVSSARDLAILGRAMLLEFPEYRDYWGIGAVQLGARVMKNTNGLIGRYPGAEGMKTGFVCASGFNVVALASRGGRTLMAVVLGAGSGAERTIRTAQLLDKGFAGSAWSANRGPVAQLPPSHFGAAPNMRQEICRKGRQIPLGEDEEGSGAISMPMAATDNASVFAVMAPSPMPGAASGVGGKSAGGRAVLGPRSDLPVLQVYLGRTPGSTEVARGPGKNSAVPANAAAFAAAPQPAVRGAGAAAKAAPNQNIETAATGAPLQLPGVITAPGPGAIGLRASTQAPRAPNAGAIQPRAKAGASAAPAAKVTVAKADAKKTEAKKADAKKVDAARTASAKAGAAKAAAQKARKKAGADDE